VDTVVTGQEAGADAGGPCNRGEPSGFSKVAAPVMAAAMRRANQKDLAAIKRILERANRD
jgi:hypothetical protein